MFYIDDNLKLIIEYNKNINSIFDYENLEIGNIYMGKVDNLVKSMNSAFINIGKDENVYLSLKDASSEIVQGENILVQVKKIPDENKALRVTEELSITGRYIIYFLEKNFIKYSSKLSKDDKNKLKDLNLSGVLFRTEAKDIDNTLIEKEYKDLKKIGDSILNTRNNIKDVKLIYENNKFIDYLYKNALDSEIIVNSKEIYKELKNDFNIKYDESFSLIYSRELLFDYKSLFNKEVDLLSGGNIVIEKTESLTAIDVNTSSFVGKNNFEDTIYKNNIEAAKEIARQIKLRNISGIIIVDFIDMKDKSHREDIKRILTEEFKDDENRTRIHGYTKLNLMEISRKNNGMELKLKI